MIADYIERKTLYSSGYDFRAPYDIDLEPGKWVDIDTGVHFDGTEKVYIKLACEDEDSWVEVERWFMLLAPRSGLGTRLRFRFANTLGIIDQDYRDNIRAMVTVDEPFHLNKGDRFMQGMLLPAGVFYGEIIPVEERKGGHGSTGL